MSTFVSTAMMGIGAVLMMPGASALGRSYIVKVFSRRVDTARVEICGDNLRTAHPLVAEHNPAVDALLARIS